MDNNTAIIYIQRNILSDEENNALIRETLAGFKRKDVFFISNNNAGALLNTKLKEVSHLYQYVVLINGKADDMLWCVKTLVKELMKAEKVGCVCARNQQSSIFSFEKTNGENDFNVWNNLESIIPNREIVPYVIPGCVAFKVAAWENNKFTENLVSVDATLIDFALKINEVGFSSILCNDVYIECSDCEGLNEKEYKALVDCYSYLPKIEKKYLDYVKPFIVKNSELFLYNTNRKQKLLINMMNLPPFFNGTSEYGLAVTTEIFNNIKNDVEITIVSNAAAIEFHKLRERYNCVVEKENLKGVYDLCFTPSQFFDLDTFYVAYAYSVRSMFTLQDIIALRCQYISGDSYKFHEMFKNGIVATDAIIFYSEATVDDINNYFGKEILENKYTQVIGLGVGDNTEVKVESSKKDYILVVGNPNKHKGLYRFIDLVKDYTEEFKIFGCPNDVVLPDNFVSIPGGTLEDEEVDLLYANCKGVIFPSFYEGFGLPILKALAARKKIIALQSELNLELKRKLNDINNDIIFFEKFADIPRLINENFNSNAKWEKTDLNNWKNVGYQTTNFINAILKQPVNMENLTKREEVVKDIQMKREIENLQNELTLYNGLKNGLLPYESTKIFLKSHVSPKTFLRLKKTKKALSLIKRGEFKLLFDKVKNKLLPKNINDDNNGYKHIVLDSHEKKKERETKFSKSPLISIVVPVYNPKDAHFTLMLESVCNQTYQKWELCLANAGNNDSICEIIKQYKTKDKRIKLCEVKKNLGISGNSNEALKIAKGEYIALLDHDDMLMPNALFEVVKVINDEENVDLIYSDEDKVSSDNNSFFDPYYKPDWSPYFFLGYNYICHLCVFSRNVLNSAGGEFNSEFDGAQDYDLFLRITEKAKNIIHIPKVLYNWRAHENSTAESLESKPYAIEAGLKSLQAHAKRCNEDVAVKSINNSTIYDYRYNVLGCPKISILIPNCNEKETLKKCVDSILSKTTYANFEIVIIENNSTDEKLFDYYKEIINDDRIQVIYYAEKESFNFSKINNWGRKFATGDFLVLLNNDMEIITPDWLSSLLSYAQRDDVGCVGARLLYPDNTIQHAGMVLGILGGAGHVYIHQRDDYPGYFSNIVVTREFSITTGACIMVSSRMFDLVGGLDERLAVNYGDVDFCLKLLRAGKRNLVVPYVKVYHYESKSRGCDDTGAKRRRAKNELELFSSRWGTLKDQYYNPNLTLQSHNYELK